MGEIRHALASPDVIVGSVAAVTESGSLVAVSASGSQLIGYVGGAGRAIWVVGAQKVVPDLDTALRRVSDHCLPLECERAMRVYGRTSAVNRILVLNGELEPGRGHRPAAPRAHRLPTRHAVHGNQTGAKTKPPGLGSFTRRSPAFANSFRADHLPGGFGRRAPCLCRTV